MGISLAQPFLQTLSGAFCPVGICARARRGQQDEQGTEDQDLSLGVSLCSCLAKAEPCVGVRGHVSVEVVSLNFLFKCQPICLVKSQYSNREAVVSLCVVQREPRDPACMGQATLLFVRGGAAVSGQMQKDRESNTCFGAQAGVWGLNRWGFRR